MLMRVAVRMHSAANAPRLNTEPSGTTGVDEVQLLINLRFNDASV